MPSVAAAIAGWLPESWLRAGLAAHEVLGAAAILHVLLAVIYIAVALRLVLLLAHPGEVRSHAKIIVLIALLCFGSLSHALVLITAAIPGNGGSAGYAVAAWLVALAGAILLWRLLPEAVMLPPASSLAREMAVRRQAEARARLSEAQMAELFHHLPDALFVIRLQPDGSFIFETVNAAFRRLVGEPERNLLGARPADFLASGTATTLERQFAEALGAKRTVEHEAAVANGEGHRIWHTLVVPLNAEGTDIRLLGSIRDVTATRRLRSDLQEASRLATIGSMCAGVAHEMSQPINVVALWAGRARASIDKGSLDPSRVSRALSIVEEQTRRLSTLLERMRDLTDESKDTGNDLFDASEAALAAVEVVSRQYALKGVSVLLAARREAMPVRGQKAQVEQALLALVANAADAVARRLEDEPDCPARVRVAIHADVDTNEVVLEVRDTGGGVPVSLQNRIFDPFFTTKDPGQGTGLGLSIAQGVARAMGGSLSTFNIGQGTPEAGAVFRLTIPLASARPMPARKIA